MIPINVTSVSGLFLLLYLSSFVLFAITRIATGISIRRLGYLSLHRIAYTPRDGVRVEVRALGLSLRRPTFVRPTWFSLRLDGLKISLDLSLLHGNPKISDSPAKGQEHQHGDTSEPCIPPEGAARKPQRQRSQLWKRLTAIKEQIKSIHGRLHWLRLLDVVSIDTVLEVVDVGRLQIGHISASVDTRRKTVDRGRLFRHKKEPSGAQKPAEWIIAMQSVFLIVGEHEPSEVLDSMSLNIHGILYQGQEGLRDTSIAVKLGRLHIPCDDLLTISSHAETISTTAREATIKSPVEEISFTDLVEELDQPGSREEAIVQTVADSKDFVSSMLRGVQEFQMALSFIRLSREIASPLQVAAPLALNVVAHEIGIDLHRLDQKSPAHRMYFARTDTAHQALIAAISISVSIDNAERLASKIMYIPMATITVKTTLPSKTVTFAQDGDATERNANILFANLVVTSPSVDLEAEQLSQLLALSRTRSKISSKKQHENHRLMSRLLPKASIKLSVHEPVARFVLPTESAASASADDYDLIISAVSSIALDVESSYSTLGQLHYSLNSVLRISSHQLYYQTSAGRRHDLVIADALELKMQLSATTEVRVMVYGSLRTFSIYMNREEVAAGVYDIVKHFDINSRRMETQSALKPSLPSFIRRLPSWLVELQLEGSDFSFETSGIDKELSSRPRGLALELASWTVDYQAQHSSQSRRPSTPRRRTTVTSRNDQAAPGASLSGKSDSPNVDFDGRRLTAALRGLEGFIIEGSEAWEAEPFMRLPTFEIALNTSRDLHGPILHVSSVIPAFYTHVSLYRFYSVGLAVRALKDAFKGPVPSDASTQSSSSAVPEVHGTDNMSQFSYKSNAELVTADIKMAFVQVKATLPADPPMLLQIYDIAAGRHRWSAPFLRCHLLRLHAEPPHVGRVWARLVSVSSIRVDMRQSRKKSGNTFITERSVDIATDFIRLSVPHGLTMYKILDNLINTVKTVEQLHHRFKTMKNDFVAEKRPGRPKHVPKVSIRSKALMFEIEDDPFEWKLGMIYRLGLLEQKQRMARMAAFQAKVRRLKEDRRPRATSHNRGQSLDPERQVPLRDEKRGRSHSLESRQLFGASSRSRDERRRKQMRYNPDGVCGLTGSAKVPANQAYEKLHEHNARIWKRRIDSVLNRQNTSLRDVRGMFSVADEPPRDEDEGEVVLGVPTRPGLMSTVISDLHLVVDKPDFPLSECSKFLHEMGKGIPLDMQYSLLIPMKVFLDMGEARILLRDYPLNLLHIPVIKSGQPPRLASWSLRSDFVIAEEFRGTESTRNRQINIIPPSGRGDDGYEVPGYTLEVCRTVSPVKTYSKVEIDINTSLPTTISWGTSYQPVIQDMMMVIESFTKPEIDPSDRVGFWDKIRLNLHSRITVNWKGNGDVHLRLKGSRDPYVVTGYGAGFVMCWRENVRWAIHATDDPREFMTVKSGGYILAIPDYSQEARYSAEYTKDEADSSSETGHRNVAIFNKVIMKLSSNVEWVAGLVFERDCEHKSRAFDFKPHYQVALRNPKSLSTDRLQDYDAYRGFRSHHIHLSLAVSAPYDRKWSFGNLKASDSYNTVHLTPCFFTQFFDWWSLFSGVMSLPIRQGKLWPGPGKTSKKFGRHLATFKYKLLLSPLFIAHVYKHRDAEEYTEDIVSATGLKLRLDSFMLDLHQRREWFDTVVKGKSKQTRASGMRIHEGQLDFINADIRALSATIAGADAEDLLRANDDTFPSRKQSTSDIDISRFTIPDHDTSWIDMDDFVELGWALPSESIPETQILPLAFTPRFTYFRQTDHGGAIHGDDTRSSPFGNEPTHHCVMSHDNDPRRVQMELVKERIHSITEQIGSHTRLMGEQELRAVRDGHEDANLIRHYELLVQQHKELLAKHDFLLAGLARLADQRSSANNSDNQSTSGIDQTVHSPKDVSAIEAKAHEGLDYLFPSSHEDFASDFDNRFMVHNVQFKWNNALRNTILRYGHQVSQRRGFIYYMSRRAVKFILDIVDEQSRSKTHPTPQAETPNQHEDFPAETQPNPDHDQEDVTSRIDELLKDAERFVDADETENGVKQENHQAPRHNPEQQLAEDFVPQNSYHIRLIAPQIQLQSEKNPKAVAIVSAKGMQLKVIAVMDKARMSDDVSGLVQRQFSLDMDGAQFFVTTQKMLCRSLHLYSGHSYGNAPSSSWPPWVSLEAMFDFELHPFGFERVIQRTSATLRYSKYNTLRLKYNEEVGKYRDAGESSDGAETRIDRLSVDFPHIRARCDSSQYYALYIIVLDLLLYSEPREKVRSERLEKIMLASDLSDLRGAPEMATSLQARIRQLEEIKNHLQIHAKYLDEQGWRDRINLEKGLASCEDELFFIMKAITTSQSQRKNDDREASQSQGLLRWYLTASEVVWHLMREKNEPLLELQLRDAAYERTDNSDGSNHNAMEIGRIHGWNLLADALYPEMIGPYYEPSLKKSLEDKDQKMIKVHWYMLEAIAGIPVLEQFQVTLFPMRIQLERDLGKKFFEYIFPGVHSNGFDGGSFSPLTIKNMQPLHDQDDDEEGEEAAKTLLPEMRGMQPLRSSSAILPATASISRRMRPTLILSNDEPPSPTKHKLKGLGIGTEHPHRNFFRYGSLSPSSPRRGAKGLSLRTFSVDRSALSARTSADPSPTNPVAINMDESRRKFGLPRSSSKDRKERDGKNSSDELSQMMARANNYMTLAHVKLDSVVICLSYKGKDDRNFEDVHDFVFRIPILEYRNKTWSNLDLALRLKKDFVRALLSHTGAIIGHKFHRRPSKQQLSRLREVAQSSQIPLQHDMVNTPSNSDTGSMLSFNPYRERSVSPRRSVASTNRRSSPPTVTESFPSSLHSSREPSLMMTPIHNPSGSLRESTSRLHLETPPHRSNKPDSGDANNRGQQARLGGGDESDQESSRTKTVMLLGKKILGSLG